ncbi:MAG TPA: ABC transporter ATP-binding protein [Cytophagaceae bacterium]|jgi:ABC-2 type transport system ATP-binding protein|nr:ABC transporter ATP-binding protein [Cytophagaceae bacterium]
MLEQDNIIVIENLSKTFPGAFEPSIKSLSFAIKRNEVFGLLGTNGAGKTTTISILCGIIKPSSGKIYVNGFDLENDSGKIKEMLGVVPQDIALYPMLTARENLVFFGKMYGLHGTDLEGRIEYWLNKFEMTKYADSRVGKYSGGMKRKINLIAGIMHDPKIVFLDEPTVGVDVQSRNEIISQLREVNKKGTTIIYTSHHMEEAEDFCTSIAIIDGGKMIAQGTPSELIQDNKGMMKLENVFLHLTQKN